MAVSLHNQEVAEPWRRPRRIHMASHNESIPDLIRGTIRDGIGLVRDEIFLARTELREEVVRVKSALITVVAASRRWGCSP